MTPQERPNTASIEVASPVSDSEGYCPPWAELEDNQYFRSLESAVTWPHTTPKPERDISPISEPEEDPQRVLEAEVEPSKLVGTDGQLPLSSGPEQKSPQILDRQEKIVTDRPNFGTTGLTAMALYSPEGTASEREPNLLEAEASTNEYKLFVVKEGNRSFSCAHPDCDQPKGVFKKRFNVERHIQTRHTGESGINCEGCDHRFSRKDNKRNHKCPQAVVSTTTSRRRKRRQRY